LYVVEPDEEITHVLTHQQGKLTYNYAFEEIKYLHGNIGYLKFNKFHPSPEAFEVVDAAFAFLKLSDGLILDMRDTIGGSPLLAQYMLSHFLPKGASLWEVLDAEDNIIDMVSVIDTVSHQAFLEDFPVWILTSHNTASASELFAGIMQANSKAIIVGDVTAGAGYYAGVRQITDDLVFRISLSKPVISVNKKNWEKSGIEPDVNVPSLDAFDRARFMSLARSSSGN
jgi:C-terminal processing protease CtpA/Prc